MNTGKAYTSKSGYSGRKYGQGLYAAARYAKNQSIYLFGLGSGATSVTDWFLPLADEYSSLAEGNLLRIYIFLWETGTVWQYLSIKLLEVA